MYKLTINNGEKEFTSQGDESILAALARNDVVLPSACGGRGRCGMCRVRITSGAPELTELEEKRLTPEQVQNKWRLACQTTINNDISLELPGQLIGSAQYECTVVRAEKLTYDIKGVTFQLPEGKEIDFKAGQYMQITAPSYGKNKKSVYRAYSIASSPSCKKSLDFCIRKVPNGMVTTWVHEHLQEGMKVTLTGPYGDFYLRESERDIIFIAGGSGLSPVLSIVLDMIDKKITNRNVHFFFGACTVDDLYYVERFRQLEQEHSWLHYIPALSNEEEVGDDCAKGLITEVVGRYYENLDNHEAYLCGSPGMIEACLKVLSEKGLDESLIFYDKFV